MEVANFLLDYMVVTFIVISRETQIYKHPCNLSTRNDWLSNAGLANFNP
jgi:hypothetical protein